MMNRSNKDRPRMPLKEAAENQPSSHLDAVEIGPQTYLEILKKEAARNRQPQRTRRGAAVAGFEITFYA